MGRERDLPQGDQIVGQELVETTGHQGPRLGLSQLGEWFFFNWILYKLAGFSVKLDGLGRARPGPQGAPRSWTKCEQGALIPHKSPCCPGPQGSPVHSVTSVFPWTVWGLLHESLWNWKDGSCEVQAVTKEALNSVITLGVTRANPRLLIGGFSGQLSGSAPCLSEGLATNNLGPILKPAKCGLLKLSSIFQLW